MRLHKYLCAGLALLLALSTLAGCQNEANQQNIVNSTRSIGQARSILVDEGQFPTTADAAAQQGELTDMVTFAAENRLNTLFFEARTGASAYYKSKYFPTHPGLATPPESKAPLDSLNYLCSQATAQKVQVIATVPAFSMGGQLPQGSKNPFAGMATSGDNLDPRDEKVHKLLANSTAELVKNYDLAGVMLTGLDASFTQGPEVTDSLEKLLRTVSAALRKADKSAVLAISFDAQNQSSAMTPQLVQKLAAEGVVQMVVPQLGADVGDDSPTGYQAQLAQWTGIPMAPAELYLLCQGESDDLQGLSEQLLANALSGKVAGSVLAPYSLLRGLQRNQRELLVSLLATGNEVEKVPMEIGHTLGLTYPQEDITVYDKAIWIMGTSDPAQPLLMGGEELPRVGSQGTFGIEIPLDMGVNAVTFAQGDSTVTVKVTRATAPGVSPITKITQGSLFPTSPYGVDNGETVEISCIGPAGASITATLAGETIVLNQAATATAGTPATFKGNVTLTGYPEDAVTSAGTVTYVVSYNGGHEVQSSPAEVVVAGKNVPLVLEVLEGQYVTNALTDVKHDDFFTQTIKYGARAAIVGKTRTTRGGNPVVAYKLSSGEYLLASKVNIVTNPAKCAVPELTLTTTQQEDWTLLDFGGGQPAVLGDLKEDVLTLRFLDSKLSGELPTSFPGELITAAEKTDTKDGFELKLTFAPGTLWGYDIIHKNESTSIWLRKSPQRGQTFGKPLEGITIMLDPGHGGSDPGALGAAGYNGPTEAMVNQAVANVAKFRLEQLGAKVLMSRTLDDERTTLDYRTFLAETERPHIFLSVHHNSTVLNKDISEIKHMEAYYWEGIAKPLADNLMASLGATTQRTTKEPENAYYYVTRLTFAPAVLFEFGFVVNPVQYEECCSTQALYRAAEGIANGIVELF